MVSGDGITSPVANAERYGYLLCWIGLHRWKEIWRREDGDVWLVLERCARCPAERLRETSPWDQM